MESLLSWECYRLGFIATLKWWLLLRRNFRCFDPEDLPAFLWLKVILVRLQQEEKQRENHWLENGN
jgi:hypothetical protein